jgi:hypothetical protein
MKENKNLKKLFTRLPFRAEKKPESILKGAQPERKR